MPKLILLLFLALQLHSSAIQVNNVQWGFDGTVKENSFNFVTIDLFNDSSKEFNDYINLAENSYQKEILTRKKIFLNPGMRKSIQMSFYVKDNYNKWSLSWAGNKQTLMKPATGSQANVYLASGNFVSRLNSRIKLFREEFFPTTASLTSSLESIILDHTPYWTRLQQEAFLDWLKKGGQLYILQGTDKKFPVFTGLLAVLNNNQTLGSGKISRSPITIRSFNLTPAKISNLKSENSDGEYIINTLRSIVKTDHNWALIYLLIFAYLGLIGPANYFIGRRTRDWKIPNLFFLVTVIGFSILFSIIGRRGYGEETKLSSFSFADHIDGDNYDVKQWTNIFVTSGAKYNLSHPGGINLYYSPSENVSLQTIADHETNSFYADIPQFSNRGLVHQSKLKGYKFSAEILDSINPSTTSVKVTSEKKIAKVWFINNGKLFNTSKSGDTFTASKENSNYQDNYYEDEERPYQSIQRYFIQALAFNKTYQSSYLDTEQNEDLLQVVILTKTPDSFHFKDSNIDGIESGWTFFRLKLLEKAN